MLKPGYEMTSADIETWEVSPSYDAEIECSYCETDLYGDHSTDLYYVVTVDDLRLRITEHIPLCRKRELG